MSKLEVESLTTRWQTDLQKAIQSDSWGQVVEAIEEYHAFEEMVGMYMKSNEPPLRLNQQQYFWRLCFCILLRIRTLNEENTTAPFPLSNIEELLPHLTAGISCESPTFPLVLSPFIQDIQAVTPTAAQLPLQGGSLLPLPPPRLDNGVFMRIRILQIQLPKAEEMHEPRLTITLVSPSGKVIGSPQDTPVASRRGSALNFNVYCHVQKAVTSLQVGTCVFYELKHFKIKKKKLSTRCYGFMPLGEVRAGPAIVPFYRKPTDFLGRKLRLMEGGDGEWSLTVEAELIKF
eukprot:gnl/Dysnectes_brevis/5574_a8078_395.p1 GENE.gnl/Dysnectes_brevis/5574_a8078_395~~gnl/Dysnectes_brevis/5574_a8078_395.p1  ORF type:complete len:289 (+),score=99.19 gnl/Dysnectes_brevis/5574_a8078_395:76-942(+)